MFKFNKTPIKAGPQKNDYSPLVMQYYEKTEHISKKDKFEYWGQQIACYKYFLGEVMKQTSIQPPIPLLD